jgi:hypothetical protein
MWGSGAFFGKCGQMKTIPAQEKVSRGTTESLQGKKLYNNNVKIIT